jgi:hypothetical protein
MNKKFYDWVTSPAKWYEVWKPQSGVLGGALLSVVVTVVIALILAIFGA